MFRIEILTHSEFEVLDINSENYEISSYENIPSSSDFMEHLTIAIHKTPDLIVMHPPFSDETSNRALNLFNETGSSRIRKVLITTAQDQLDDWFGFEDGYRTVRVYEPLFKSVFQGFIKNLFEYGMDMNEALIHSVMSKLQEEKSNKALTLIDNHKNRNIHGAHRMARLSSNYPSKRPSVWEDLIQELEKLIPLSKQGKSSAEFPVPAIIHSHLDEPLLQNTRRVFFADDEHYRGWSTILPAILLGRTDLVFLVSPVTSQDGTKKFQITKPGHQDFRPILVDNAYSMDSYPILKKGFFIINPSDNICDDIQSFLEREKVNETQYALFPFDLILLDFRLHDEKSGVPVKQVSGHRIAKWIHSKDPSVPIIVVSASDKVWTLLSMRSQGTWDYYLKPDAHDNNTLDFANLEIDRLYRTLQAADKYIAWARAIYTIGEWCASNSGITSVEQRNTPGSEIRQIISVVSQTVTSLSRFALDLEEEENKPSAPVGLSFQMLAMTWESIISEYESPRQYLKELQSHSSFTENSSDIVGFSALQLLARAYRNLHAHNSLNSAHGIEFETHLTLWSLSLALITLKESDDIVLQVLDHQNTEIEKDEIKRNSLAAVKEYLLSDSSIYTSKVSNNIHRKLDDNALSLDAKLSSLSHTLLGFSITTILDLLIQATVICTNDWLQSKRRNKTDHGYCNIYEFAYIQFSSAVQRIVGDIMEP